MTFFISNLASSINDFIAFKNSIGIEYKTAIYDLRQLDIYNFDHDNLTIPTKDLVEGWANTQANKSISQDRSWISPIREYGRYLISVGVNDAYILDKRYITQEYKAETYLMTEEEIKGFFIACDSNVLTGNFLGGAHIYPALYRFLYCCGTRCGEARKIRCEDIHLDKCICQLNLGPLIN